MALTAMLGAPQLASAQSLPDPLRTKWWVIDLGMPCGCESAADDIDGNDVVGATDLAALLTAWGAPCTLDAVWLTMSCARAGEGSAARAAPDAALMAAVALFGFESTEEFSAWLASLPESLARSVGESLLWQLEIHNSTGGAE